jgi:type I restriction enzyme S subunit
MATEWEIGKLSDIAEIVMGQSPPGETCNETENGLPLLNGPTEFGGHHPDPVQFTTDPRKYAEIEDLLFCVRGSTTGRMNWADQRYAIGRGIAAIRHKDGKEYQPFLKAVVDAGLPTLLASATGSTFPNVSREQLRDLECVLPPLAEQKRIAEVLGALDEKIELNRRMNATLEATARALFQSWFVDFDPVRAILDLPFGQTVGRTPSGMDAATAALFPDSFEHEADGVVPKGWSIGTVKDAFEITMGQSPPGDTYNEDGNGIPFYQGRTDFGFRFPTRRMYCTAPTRYAKQGDTLVSVRAPVGDINMADEECCIGRGVASVRHKSGASSFTYYAMANLYPDFAAYEAEGTVFGSINKQNFENLRCIVPSPSIVSAYEKLVGPLDEQISTFEKQSRTLATLRDTLLPQLLSGELSLQDAV